MLTWLGADWLVLIVWKDEGFRVWGLGFRLTKAHLGILEPLFGEYGPLAPHSPSNLLVPDDIRGPGHPNTPRVWDL